MLREGDRNDYDQNTLYEILKELMQYLLNKKETAIFVNWDLTLGLCQR